MLLEIVQTHQDSDRTGKTDRGIGRLHMVPAPHTCLHIRIVYVMQDWQSHVPGLCTLKNITILFPILCIDCRLQASLTFMDGRTDRWYAFINSQGHFDCNWRAKPRETSDSTTHFSSTILLCRLPWMSRIAPCIEERWGGVAISSNPMSRHHTHAIVGRICNGIGAAETVAVTSKTTQTSA